MRLHQDMLAAIALYALGAEAALRQFDFTVHSDTRSPDGFEREVYLINGQQPGPLIDVDEGDDIEVLVRNDLKVETTMHWHGLLQRGTPHMDGVPGITQDPISPGGNFTYRFSTGFEYGFFWYHSHFRAYYSDAIRGPLLIRPAASRQRPFEALAQDDDEKSSLLRAEKQATNVLLNDWTHELSDVIFARYIKTGAFPSCVDSILANGLGRVQCLPDAILQAGPDLGIEPDNEPTATVSQSVVSDMPGMSGMPRMNLLRERDMHDMTMDMSMSMASIGYSTTATAHHSTTPLASDSPGVSMMDSLGPHGCMLPMMFKPGFDQSSLPPETCTNTSSPLLVVSANQTTGWLALNLANSGAVSALSISLDGHSMFVYAADGLYVELQETKVLHMELGQRYSVMVKLDQRPGNYNLRFATYPSGDMQQVLEGRAIVSYSAGNSTDDAIDNAGKNWMFVNGSAKAGASRLNPQELSPFDRTNSPPTGAADKTISFMINQTGIVTWVMNRAPFREPDIPIIYGEVSSGWNSPTTMHMPFNSTIDIVLSISNHSMDTMGHPLHLHGHKFWVLGSGNGSFPYKSVTNAPMDMLNLRNPAYRDTTGLPSQGWAVIRYVTDNPGAWIFHCHLQWHVAVGMAVVLVEGDDQLSALVGQYNKSAPSVGSGGINSATGSCVYSWLAAALMVSMATIWC